MKDRKLLGMALLAIILLPAALASTQTAFWEMGTFEGFLKGNLQGVSVSMNGQLTLAPETRAVFNPDEAVALSEVADPSTGRLFVGTGHQGKVFVLDKNMHGRLLFQAPEPEILALAVGRDHDLYVGSSPEGKIYRVTPSGKSSVFCNPKAKYIWALAFDSQGRLYVGTGDKGQILRVDRDGKVKLFFASNQTHIMCLAFDQNGNLLAGSDPNGLIYRISPNGKAFVLYQANLPEIHALDTDASGSIYAAALGNAVPTQAPGYFPKAPVTNLVSAEPTKVTVIASAGDVDEAANRPQRQQKPPSHQPVKPRQQPGQPSLNPNASAGIGAPFQAFARGRGELIQILPNYTAQILWTSDNQSIFGLATRGSDVVFSTEDDGRIFDLRTSADGPKLTLLSETRESLPTHILAAGPQLFVTTSNIAKLIQIGTALGTHGTYESPVEDTHFISRWGHIAWRAHVPPACKLEFYTRSGNSARPDNTWSDWAGPYLTSEGSQISSTPARYLQWKAAFSGTDGKSPELEEVTVSYLNQNLPPEIQSFTVSQGAQKTKVTGTPVVSTGEGQPFVPMPMVTSSIVAVPAYTDPEAEGLGHDKPPVIFSWQAEDPNHDRLLYDLYLKSTTEREWHILKGKLRTADFTLPPDSLANGEYQAKLVASDAPSNTPQDALRTDLVSAPFWVDNTSPQVRVLSRQVHDRSAVIRFQAQSDGAPLDKADVSVGENRWRGIVSDNGIVDSQQEIFTVKLPNLQPGEHVISLRAYDTAGNVGVGQTVIDVP